MSRIALIGGSGFYNIEGAEICNEYVVHTPFGKPSDKIYELKIDGSRFLFLARHGKGHAYLPHQINYRANMYALRSLAVSHIFAFNVVGGITSEMAPNTLVIPHQIIDYTYQREQSFNNANEIQHWSQGVQHIDFTFPFSRKMRKQFCQLLNDNHVDFIDGGVYACTQGPRLESAAEIHRLSHDGADIVGMTVMPEAALARELCVDYLCASWVVNWAAGIDNESLSMDSIMENCHQGVHHFKKIFPTIIKKFDLCH